MEDLLNLRTDLTTALLVVLSYQIIFFFLGVLKAQKEAGFNIPND